MINYRKTIFIINDYFGHGGHVKSFITQFRKIKTNNFLIICAKDGYIYKNIDFINIEINKLIFVEMDNIRKYQINYKLFKTVKNNLIDESILNIYSFDCYFSTLLAKTYFKNVSIINSVMGGPNPFPLFDSTDNYIAVSKEQKEYVISNGFGKNINEEKVKIIKNRIEINQIKNDKKNLKNYVLVVSRFDMGMQKSLENISKILSMLPKSIEVKIAGTGKIIDEYKKKFENYENINFLGYCNNISELRENASVVLGMGRSILESLIQGKASILVGYKGIEMLEELETIKFASDYNFAGRKIKNSISYDLCIKRISDYHKNDFILNDEVKDFLIKEYSIDFFKNKYQTLIKNIKPHKVSKAQVFLEYLYFFYLRLKRKLIK